MDTNPLGECYRCKAVYPAQLHQIIQDSGAEVFGFFCTRCETQDPFRTGMFIPAEEVKSELTDSEIDQLPFKFRARTSRCAKCGSRNCQLHHWAPRAIFGREADDWPTDYLCQACHDKWHEMVTPQLRSQ